MNELTQEQLRQIAKLSSIPHLGRLLSNESTEWKGIVDMQNAMSDVAFGKYVYELSRMGCNLVNATIEQRVAAFIKIFRK